MEVACSVCRGTGVVEKGSIGDSYEKGRRIIVEVAVAHEIFVPDLVGIGRTRRLVEARQEAIKRMREETPLGLKQIGFLLNRRHHSTIHSALARSGSVPAVNGRYSGGQGSSG